MPNCIYYFKLKSIIMWISYENLGKIAMKTWTIYDGNIYMYIFFFYLSEIAIW